MRLLLNNDDKNSMQTVIMVTCFLMGYDPIRAEQLATIAHYKGKAVLKEDCTVDQAFEYQRDFETNNINVTIE